MSSTNLKSKTSWDLSKLFLSLDDPQINSLQEQNKKTISQFVTNWKDRTDYLSDPRVLSQALAEYEKFDRQFGTYDRIGYFYSLSQSLDSSDATLKAAIGKLHDLVVKAHNDLEFFFHRISKIDPQKHQTFLTHPDLSQYKHFLFKLFEESKHVLSEPEEKILTLTSKSSFSSWVKMTDEFIDASIEKGKTLEQWLSQIQHKEQKVRDEANKAINKILKTHVKVAEHEINAILHTKKVSDELRQFSRPDQSRHLSDDVDSIVVDTLIKSVSDNFSVSHEWYQLRASLMGRKTINYQDRLASLDAQDQKFQFQKASELVSKVFHDLDTQFGNIFDQYLQSGQIDVFPKLNKSGGAFCAHLGLDHPTYILLNHTDTLRDCLTLAHEAGHGINNELMKEKCNSYDFGTPVSTAEVASTFCEDFVLDKLATNATPRQALDILIHKIDDDISSIFRQVALYRFEQELHSSFREQGFLSHQTIGELFIKHMSAYTGPAVKYQEGHQNWWVYWSHIRSFFYVYSYASGLLISKSLQTSVRADKKFIFKVKEFLSAGTSDSPKNIFARLGVDITDEMFWEKGISQIKENISKARSLAQELKLYR